MTVAIYHEWRVFLARVHASRLASWAFVLSLGRPMAPTSTRNPPPTDFVGRVVLQIDEGNNVTIRPESAATETDEDTVHDFFVVCCAIGVRSP
jgi:hypothetical protein